MFEFLKECDENLYREIVEEVEPNMVNKSCLPIIQSKIERIIKKVFERSEIDVGNDKPTMMVLLNYPQSRQFLIKHSVMSADDIKIFLENINRPANLIKHDPNSIEVTVEMKGRSLLFLFNLCVTYYQYLCGKMPTAEWNKEKVIILINGGKPSSSDFVSAAGLREQVNLAKIPNYKPGYYKWWATEEVLAAIFDNLNLTRNEIDSVKECLEKKDNYYCIYVGVAIKDSIQSRLNTHVNQYTSERNVRFSTLRKSLTGIFSGNKNDFETTNEIIDKLYIEYYAIDLPIHSDEADKQISSIEKELLSCENLYILNIKENKHPRAYIIKNHLSKLRKELV